jgi:cell division protein FtsZ
MVESDTLLKFDHPKEQSSIIKVIGVGGGGSNAVNHMYRKGIHGVDFMICNTDAQAIEMSPVPVKVQLGHSLTGGNGAGSNPEIGMNAAIENIEDIREVFSHETRMVFITAGMGGGTGTGGAPVIARLAKEMGILTIGIVTIPFSFEGRKRRQLAETGIQELRKNVDTLLIINNDKLRELHGNLELREAFEKADNVLTEAARGIAEIITHVGYINVDFEDVKTVMKDSGVAIMGTGVAEGENRALMAVEDAINSPLLNDNQISGASNVLLYIASGTKRIRLDEVSEITDYIQREAGSSADIIWGNGEDERLGESIAVTIIATGFQAKQEIPAVERKQAGTIIVGTINPLPDSTTSPVKAGSLIDDLQVISRPAPVQTDPIFGSYAPSSRNDSPESTPAQGTPEGLAAEMAQEPFVQPAATSLEEPVILKSPSNPDYSEIIPLHQPMAPNDPRMKIRQERLRSLTSKFQTPEGMSELENVPAFKRRNMQLNDPVPSNESQVSKFALNNGDETSMSENPFLHSESD